MRAGDDDGGEKVWLVVIGWIVVDKWQMQLFACSSWRLASNISSGKNWEMGDAFCVFVNASRWLN